MREVTLTLENAEGLHARPAAVLAKMAGQFTAKVEIKAKGQQKNAKSIMGLMALGLEKGDQILLVAEGADEQNAVEQISALIRGGFQEQV